MDLGLLCLLMVLEADLCDLTGLMGCNYDVGLLGLGHLFDRFQMDLGNVSACSSHFCGGDVSFTLL